MKSLHLALTLIVAIAFTVPAFADDDDPRFVEVTGVGIVTQSPDIANVAFSVETQDKAAKKANRTNASQTSRLIKSLKAAGIAPNDIKTQHYSVSPRYKDRSRGDRDLVPIGFVVNNTVTVTVRKLRDLGSLIDKAGAPGATRVNPIRFELSDPTDARQEALRRAMKHARSEALTLLEGLPSSLGPVLHIKTQGGHYAPKSERGLMASARMDTPIEPGTLDTRAQVVVAFQILDKPK